MKQLVFCLILLAVVWAHIHAWLAFFRGRRWWLSLGGMLMMAGGFALLLAGAVLHRLGTQPWREHLYFAAVTWLGFMFFLELVLIAAALLRRLPCVRAPAPAGSEPDQGRRALLTSGGAQVAIGCAIALSAGASVNAMQPVSVRRHRLRLWGDGRQPLRVVQISDLHVGSTIAAGETADLARTVNGLQADLILITGDLLDAKPAQILAELAPLFEMKSKLGVCMSPGNHEYYCGWAEWRPLLEQRGIRVLQDESALFELDGRSFHVVGINDEYAGPDVQQAFAGLDAAPAPIIMAHQPKSIHRLEDRRGLVLSGHTHGGQLWPFGWAVRLAQPYVRGLHRHRPGLWIYIHSGSGWWGPPMRLGTQRELALFELD